VTCRYTVRKTRPEIFRYHFEITRPILKYVRDYPRLGPRDVITVIIPKYVVGHWWEQLLHNQTALRLKTRLLFQPSVVVIDVPWHLRSTGVSTTAHDQHLHEDHKHQAISGHQPTHYQTRPPGSVP
jgi:hypothetical protein